MRRLYKRVVIESPFGGPTPEAQEENLRYLRACMRDCLDRGEAPFASHGLYTQPGVLDDWDPQEREKGILAGFEWRLVAQATIVYADRGISSGMRAGIRKATELQQHGTFDHYVEYRFLGGEWSALGGPEEIRRHLDELLKDEGHNHRHLPLVSGAATAPRQVQMMSTPAERSMASVGVVPKAPEEANPLRGPSGLEDKPFVRSDKPNGPIHESYKAAANAAYGRFTGKPPHVPGCIVPNCPGCSDGDPVSIDEPDNRTVEFLNPAQAEAMQAEMEKLDEQSRACDCPDERCLKCYERQERRSALGRQVHNLLRCEEWLRWKPNQGMTDGQCTLQRWHLGDHEFDCKPTDDVRGRTKHVTFLDDAQPDLKKFEGEFGEAAEAAPPKKRSVLDPYLNYQYDDNGPKPLTLDEVKDALKQGGEARKEAEKTIKRPARH